MIQCKVVDHGGVKTIQHDCSKCGKTNIRSFGTQITKEFCAKVCWECNASQPAILNLLHNISDRVQYHRTSVFPTVVISGVY